MLHAGQQLSLGDTILAGAGIHATLHLSRPKGVTEEAELVYIRPVAKTPHLVTLLKAGSAAKVTIAD